MRPLRAEIDLGRLRDNYRALKRIHGNKLLAVVKADAYGHGAVRCALALADLADGFGVACIEEAVELRRAGIANPIVLLEGVFDASEYGLVDEYGLWPAVCGQWQLEALLRHSWRKPATVWLKMDSGMHRAGFFPHDYPSAFQTLKQSGCVADIVKFSHFSRADEMESGMTARQTETFDAACAGLAGEASLANSAALLAHPATRREWGRAGLALYGVDPFTAQDARILPVMRFFTAVFGTRVLQPHEPIGYGASFYTERSMLVGLIACGYADGYPRRASTGSPVAVDGIRSSIVGRVSMDMITVDLTGTGGGIGSEVELWGDKVSVNEVAACADTVAYELLCRVRRARFVYID